MKIADPGRSVPVLSSPSGLGGSAASAASQWKEPVRVATTAAITLATGLENGDTIDGVTLATGDRVLVKNQASGLENGIYVVNASGAPDRALDFDHGREVWGAWVYVIAGSTLAATVWYNTNTTQPVIDSDALTFAQFTGGGSVTYATTSDIADVAATESAGAATTVPRGDHVHRLGITTTRGDLIRRGATDNERVALGTTGYRLASDGTDAVWAATYRMVPWFLSGGSSVLSTGLALWIGPFPFSGVIEDCKLDSFESGSIVIDIGKAAETTWAGSHFASICASDKPTITTARRGGSALSGWTTTIGVGDMLTFNVDSVTSIKRVSGYLKVRET